MMEDELVRDAKAAINRVSSCTSVTMQTTLDRLDELIEHLSETRDCLAAEVSAGDHAEAAAADE